VATTICGFLIGVAALIALPLMFIRAIRRSNLPFHGGELHGWSARVVGAIGLLGFASALYLMLGYMLHIKLQGTPVAVLLLCLACLVLLALRVASVFWHRWKS